MKFLTTPKIRLLFLRILFSLAGFSLICAVCAGLHLKHAALWVLLSSLGMGLCVFASMYLYFQEQERIMEEACAQIRDFLSGDRDAHISCDEEGGLYRLFYEVNSLVSILNAHAENEKKAKSFLKDTISNISHQLKTPLAALNIYNGLLQAEAADSPEIARFASLSEQELDRIDTLVQNLLKITKLDAGTLVLEKKKEYLSEMMERIERQFAWRAQQEGKTLSLSGDDAVTLSCDRTWLLEAVGNIVKNAFDHTRKGCAIRIQWRAFAAVVQISVSDDGSGIHPEDLPHIFKRFYRSRYSPDTQGIGLGLPLARAVVEAHGGTIEADSETGAGTTFTMNFLISSG